MDVTSPNSPTVVPQTVEQVAQKYWPRVYAVAHRLLGDLHDAEDVAQEVLLKVVRYLGTFRRDASLFTWLHAITVYTARDYRRRKFTRTVQGADPDLLDDLPGVGNRPDGPALSREMRNQFDRAVAGLPTVYREAYVLADVDGRSHDEVGELLGVNPRTVRTRTFRARQLLRADLAPYFGA